jgi:hypothetical protein
MLPFVFAEDEIELFFDDTWERFEFQSRICKNPPLLIPYLGLSSCQAVTNGSLYRDLAAEAAEQLVEDKDELPNLQPLRMVHEGPHG